MLIVVQAGIRPPSTPFFFGSNPTTMEALLEKQWDQSADFLMNQASSSSHLDSKLIFNSKHKSVISTNNSSCIYIPWVKCYSKVVKDYYTVAKIFVFSPFNNFQYFFTMKTIHETSENVKNELFLSLQLMIRGALTWGHVASTCIRYMLRVQHY